MNMFDSLNIKPFKVLVYMNYVNTAPKARLFSAVFLQLNIFTADCLRHAIHMAGVETIWGR